MKNNFYLNETKDYNSFEFMSTNRKINTKKVHKFVNLIKKTGIQSPIIVNNKNQIVDGQHRFIALRQLGYVVPYIVSNVWNNTKDTIVMQEGTKWTALDYCYSQSKEGNIDCKQAIEVSQMFYKQSNNKIKEITTLELLLDGPNYNVLQCLKTNTYKINVKIAYDIFKILQKVSKYPTATSIFGQKITRPLKKLYYKNNGLDIKVIEKMFKNNYIKGFAKQSDQLEYLTDLYNKYNK